MLSATMLLSLFTLKADYLYDKKSRHSIAVINLCYYRICVDGDYYIPLARMAVQRTVSHDSFVEKEYATVIKGQAVMDEYFPLKFSV